MHRDSMNRYLNDMIQIPLAGPAFFTSLCSGAKLVAQTITPAGSTRSATTTIMNDLGPARGGRKNKAEIFLPPMHSFQQVASAVKVTNWTEVDGDIYFVIEISQKADYVHKRIVRKKYKQFRSLHTLLSVYATPHKNIAFPSPGSSAPPASKNTDNTAAPAATPEEKIKVRGKRAQQKLISELNTYLQSICEIQPVPDILTAFLESDITSVSAGYDVVIIKNAAHIIDQDQHSYMAKAGQVVYLTECYVRDSTPALNTLGEEWHHADSRDTLHETLLQSNMIDAIGLGDADGIESEESITSVITKALTLLLTLLRYFSPDWDDSDFISGKNLRIIDANVSADTARPRWLLQWRLNRMVLATSAFADFSVLVSKLKTFDLKALKKHSDDEKAAFFVNLYNCMSLHAALLLPWPDVSQGDARALWQHHARYNIGGVKLSLLGIEYSIIRPVLGAVKYPTIPNSNVCNISCSIIMIDRWWFLNWIPNCSMQFFQMRLTREFCLRYHCPVRLTQYKYIPDMCSSDNSWILSVQFLGTVLLKFVVCLISTDDLSFVMQKNLCSICRNYFVATRCYLPTTQNGAEQTKYIPLLCALTVVLALTKVAIRAYQKFLQKMENDLWWLLRNGTLLF